MSKDAFAKLPPQYQKLLMEAQPEANKAMIAAYREADKVNLPMFKQKLTEIRYSDADLKKFREIAGKPVWDKWVADNKAKFDAQGVLDALLKELDTANAKHAKKYAQASTPSYRKPVRAPAGLRRRGWTPRPARRLSAHGGRHGPRRSRAIRRSARAEARSAPSTASCTGSRSSRR